MADYYHPQSDQYRKWDLPAPATATHGTEGDIREKMTPMLPAKWRMEGNQLIAETENGTHAQTIPSDRLLVGTDSKGLPIFRKIEV